MKHTKPSLSLSVITLTLLLTACSGANSGPSTPDANNGASTTNTTTSTGSPSPSIPTTPGPELPTPTPATPSQPVNPAVAAIAALEVNGSIPKLDRSDSLAGPDLDGNGVRDDVGAWIQGKLTDPKQIAAAMQFAKVMQQAVLVDASNNSGTRIVGKNMSIAISCVFSRFPDEGPNSSFQILKKIEALTSNTKYRLKAYLAYNRSRDGTT